MTEVTDAEREDLVFNQLIVDDVNEPLLAAAPVFVAQVVAGAPPAKKGDAEAVAVANALADLGGGPGQPGGQAKKSGGTSKKRPGCRAADQANWSTAETGRLLVLAKKYTVLRAGTPVIEWNKIDWEKELPGRSTSHARNKYRRVVLGEESKAGGNNVNLCSGCQESKVGKCRCIRDAEAEAEATTAVGASSLGQDIKPLALTCSNSFGSTGPSSAQAIAAASAAAVSAQALTAAAGVAAVPEAPASINALGQIVTNVGPSAIGVPGPFTAVPGPFTAPLSGAIVPPQDPPAARSPADVTVVGGTRGSGKSCPPLPRSWPHFAVRRVSAIIDEKRIEKGISTSTKLLCALNDSPMEEIDGHMEQVLRGAFTRHNFPPLDIVMLHPDGELASGLDGTVLRAHLCGEKHQPIPDGLDPGNPAQMPRDMSTAVVSGGRAQFDLKLRLGTAYNGLVQILVTPDDQTLAASHPHLSWTSTPFFVRSKVLSIVDTVSFPYPTIQSSQPHIPPKPRPFQALPGSNVAPGASCAPAALPAPAAWKTPALLFNPNSPGGNAAANANAANAANAAANAFPPRSVALPTTLLPNGVASPSKLLPPSQVLPNLGAPSPGRLSPGRVSPGRVLPQPAAAQSASPAGAAGPSMPSQPSPAGGGGASGLAAAAATADSPPLNLLGSGGLLGSGFSSLQSQSQNRNSGMGSGEASREPPSLMKGLSSSSQLRSPSALPPASQWTPSGSNLNPGSAHGSGSSWGDSWSGAPRGIDPAWQPLRALLREAPPEVDVAPMLPSPGGVSLGSPGVLLQQSPPASLPSPPMLKPATAGGHNVSNSETT